ncbi:MAG: hypothetical protein ABI831_06230 [Betaproteobacteria bacterium]
MASLENRRKPVAASKRPLYLIALMCLAPIVGSFALYYWMPPSRQINYGTLIAPRPLPDATLHGLDGKALALRDLRGKWLLVSIDAAPCEAPCAARLYATRQARTMQGKERERVNRLWLVTGDGAPPPELQAAHPDLLIARADPALLAALPVAETGAAIYLVDPLGNLMLRYPAEPDIKRLHKDIARLLYASRIG